MSLKDKIAIVTRRKAVALASGDWSRRFPWRIGVGVDGRCCSAGAEALDLLSCARLAAVATISADVTDDFRAPAHRILAVGSAQETSWR